MREVPEHLAPAVGDLIASAPRELLEALLASVADAVYLVDPDGRVQFLNAEALAILGYDDPSELLGRVSHPTIHYKHVDGSPFPDAECPMLRPRLTGETVRIDEDWFVRRDGSMVPVSYSSAPLPDPSGRRAAVVVFRDITDRRAEEEVRRREEVQAARLAELDASRARLIAAADAERRRLGRDLHDGAQQRLTHVLMLLREERVADAGAEVRAAIAELRELVAGIHPAILTNRGLRAAVEALTARAPVPVEIDIPLERHAPEVEATAYFLIAEALTNVAKHAPGAGHAAVAVEARDGGLHVLVADDGPGGATPGGAEGSGLVGLADRLAALGGTIAVDSPAGGGTRLRASVPLRD